MYYLRKIIRGKWPAEGTIAQATLRDIPADTVLAELQTDKNKLSVWKIENDQDLLDAFVALGSNSVSIGTIDAVKIDADCISDLKLDNEKGDTPTIGINEKHRNITELNYSTLGDVINSIILGIRSDGGYVRKTKGEMKRLLVEAYRTNRLIMDQLAPNMKNSILMEADRLNGN